MRHAVLLLLTAWTPALAQTRDASASNAAVDRVFAAFSDTLGPGCSVGVSRNGAVLYEHGYGMANLETGTRNSPASIFHVASVSKQFTAAAIMLLARDGKLSIDDNIRKYVPEIPDYGTPITIRHLLTHTSGLRDQWDLISMARGRFEENRITEADVMDLLTRQTALNFTPGAEFLYSNSGYTVLAVIVKRVSGASLRDFADARIFKPLGMTKTHFHDDFTMIVPGRTSAYARTPQSSWRVSIPNFDVPGATSLFTTVGDLLTWEANFDAPRVGDAAMFAQMQTMTPLTSGDTSDYGFGLTMTTYHGYRVVEHTGADAGYRSYAGRFPDQRLAIAIACNASNANTVAFAHGVADAFLPATGVVADQPRPSPRGVQLSASQLQRHAGFYLDPVTMWSMEVSMQDGKLVLGHESTPVLIPLSDTRFAVTGETMELRFLEGDHPGLTMSIPGQRLQRFERRQAVPAPTAATLSQYVGEYVSDELAGAVYRITASDSTLIFRIGNSSPLNARMVFADVFGGWAGNRIQFLRSPTGRVSGYELTTLRTRRVKFVRR